MWNVEEIELIVSEKGGSVIFRDTIDYRTTYNISDIEGIEINNTYTWQIIGKRKGDETIISNEGSFRLEILYSVANELVGLTTTVYPNPIKNNLNLKLNSDSNRLLSIEMIDLSGRKVADFGRKIIGGEAELHFDVSHITSGNYSLIITDDKGNSTVSKVVIAK